MSSLDLEVILIAGIWIGAWTLVATYLGYRFAKREITKLDESFDRAKNQN